VSSQPGNEMRRRVSKERKKKTGPGTQKKVGMSNLFTDPKGLTGKEKNPRANAGKWAQTKLPDPWWEQHPGGARATLTRTWSKNGWVVPQTIQRGGAKCCRGACRARENHPSPPCIKKGYGGTSSSERKLAPTAEGHANARPIGETTGPQNQESQASTWQV